jgi:hypothetical protein
MRKEELLYKKQRAINNMEWYIREQFSDEILKTFSLKQLEILVNISSKANEYREKREQFHSLSCNDVVHCPTGTLIYVDDDGNVKKETEEDILNSASCEIYKHWKEKRYSK